MYSMLMGFP